MQHGCVAVQVGNARGGLTIAAREGVPKEQIILGEILEPLGTHLSLQGGPGGEFIYSDPGYTALIDSAVAVGGRATGVPLNSRLENDLPAITAKVSALARRVSGESSQSDGHRGRYRAAEGLRPHGLAAGARHRG